MALPITDYTAFFAGAKQAVQELEQLRERELCLEESERALEDQLRSQGKGCGGYHCQNSEGPRRGDRPEL